MRRYLFLAAILWVSIASADDWPAWRHDASRSGCTAEQLPTALHLQWTRHMPAARPAWVDDARTAFDHGYEPIVVGKTLIVASNANDKLQALDADSGAVKWEFFAQGPFRVPPAAWEGNVYAACDDGFVYCLAVADGALKWKFDGRLGDRWVLGNDRMISLWPCRGGPAIADGKVYCTVGIWPFMGTMIYCLDAKDGKVVWCNSGSGSDFLVQQHDSAAFGGVAPQGCLAVAGDKLLVSGGRTPPAAYDLATGKFLYFNVADRSPAKQTGDYKLAAGGTIFFNDRQAYAVADGRWLLDAGSFPVLDADSLLTVAKGSLRAYRIAPQVKVATAPDRRGNPATQQVVTLAEIWAASAEASLSSVYLKAGTRAYGVLADGGIGAVDLPAGKEPAKVSWRQKLDGKVWTMLAADGKLFVAAQDGRILCYGQEPKASPLDWRMPLVVPPVAGDIPGAGKTLNLGRASEGYCLVLGLGDGQLAKKIAGQTKMHVIVIDPDEKSVAQFRSRMDALGLYGSRIAAIVADPASIELPPYFASVIIRQGDAPELPGASNSPAQATTSAVHGALLSNMLYCLRPYDGRICLATSDAQHQAIESAIATGEALKRLIPGEKPLVSRQDGFTIITRPGPLPGAGGWTHQYADAANTVVSPDRLARAPLGVLWFGGPSNAGVLPRHGHGPTPQVLGGRLFIEGPNSMRATDVYTGRLLWEVTLKDVGKYYDNTNHQPGANEIGSNYVTTDDGVYVVVGRVCRQLDPATGKSLRQITLPALDGEEKPYWGYIGAWGDLLIAGAMPTDLTAAAAEPAVNTQFGSGSKYLVVMERRTGKVLWTLKARNQFRHNAIAVGGDKLFCIDGWSTAKFDILKRRGLEPTVPARLLALEARTGKTIWETDKGVFGTWLGYRQDRDMLLEATSPATDRAKDESPQEMTFYKASDGRVLNRCESPYRGPCMLYSDKLITQSWAMELATFAKKTRRHPMTGQEIEWGFKRNYGCNTAIGSEYLLTFRSAMAGYYDLSADDGTGNLGGFRSGCTSNLIVADGVLNAPDYTRTCVCAYQIQASVGLVHMPEAETWTFNPLPMPSDKPQPVRRLGLNFGAPGDRLAADGTLWLDCPSKGGRSPDVPVAIEPADCELFRRHSLTLKSGQGPAYVAASGVEGATRITVRPFLQVFDPTDKQLSKTDVLTQPAKPQGEFDPPRRYTIKLHFAETGQAAPGGRVFDVAIQGKTALKGFDVSAAGGVRQSIVKEFKGVEVHDNLVVDLAASAGKPILCGLEMIEE